MAILPSSNIAVHSTSPPLIHLLNEQAPASITTRGARPLQYFSFHPVEIVSTTMPRCCVMMLQMNIRQNPRFVTELNRSGHRIASSRLSAARKSYRTVILVGWQMEPAQTIGTGPIAQELLSLVFGSSVACLLPPPR